MTKKKNVVKRIASKKKTPKASKSSKTKHITIKINNQSNATGGGGGSSAGSRLAADRYDNYSSLQQSENRILDHIRTLKSPSPTIILPTPPTPTLPKTFQTQKLPSITMQPKPDRSPPARNMPPATTIDLTNEVPVQFKQEKVPSVSQKAEAKSKAEPPKTVRRIVPDDLPNTSEIVPRPRDPINVHVPEQFRKPKIPISRPSLPPGFQPELLRSIADMQNKLVPNENNQLVVYKDNKKHESKKSVPVKKTEDRITVYNDRSSSKRENSLVKRRIEEWNKRELESARRRELEESKKVTEKTLKRIIRRKKNLPAITFPDFEDDSLVSLGKRDAPLPDVAEKKRKS